MRRTASLDAIFSRGAKNASGLQPHFSHYLDKATQTPEEWAAYCLAEGSSGVPCSGCSSSECASDGCANWQLNGSFHANCTNGFGTPQRRGSAPVQALTASVVPPPSPDNIDKLLRQRLQRANKEGNTVRQSPLHGDHSVLVKPYACVQTHMSADPCARGAGVRMMVPRLRSSVEELNQEIERLVLRPPVQYGSEDEDELHQDGRQAPLPSYLRSRRSVNTQTPGRCSTSDHSSSPGTPSPLPSPVPPGSPSAPPRLASSVTSPPHINKFLSREPPDGCERVALRHSTDEVALGAASSWPAATRPAVFTLLPSLGSAFCAPGRSAVSVSRVESKMVAGESAVRGTAVSISTAVAEQ